MKLEEILVERVVNAFDAADKKKYATQVWDMLQVAYGGDFRSAANKEELIDDSGLWKLVFRAGKLTAVNVYKDSHGRKSIASATDKTTQGKRDYIMMKNDDVKFERAWGEVSGAPEAIMKKSGLKPVPNKFAHALTGKEILSLNDDGFHYTRMIGGHPEEKIIYGAPQLDDKLKAKLKDAGISLKELPTNIKLPS